LTSHEPFREVLHPVKVEILQIGRSVDQLPAGDAEQRGGRTRLKPHSDQVDAPRRAELHRPGRRADEERRGLPSHLASIAALEPVGQVEDDLGPAVGHGSLELGAARSGPPLQDPEAVHQRPQSGGRGELLVAHRQPAAVPEGSRLACW
jgi:hypothetical protein